MSVVTTRGQRRVNLVNYVQKKELAQNFTAVDVNAPLQSNQNYFLELCEIINKWIFSIDKNHVSFFRINFMIVLKRGADI